MKVTRLGRTRPLIGLDTYLGGAVGPGGQVPTSNGSNGIAWGSNVGTIWVNGTTQVMGPAVNFANGSNTLVTVDMVGAAASNTIRVHVTGVTSDPADDTYVWMPLTSHASNTGAPELVWDGDGSLIPTLVPLE
jgi:hypothetical protein